MKSLGLSFAYSIAAALVPLWTVQALSFRGRVRIRFWLAGKMMDLARWLDRNADKIAPSWRERATAGMED